jgi:hypothetical protein
VKDCHERELVRKRRLRGQAIFEFTISPGGDVATADFTPTLPAKPAGGIDDLWHVAGYCPTKAAKTNRAGEPRQRRRY